MATKIIPKIQKREADVEEQRLRNLDIETEHAIPINNSYCKQVVLFRKILNGKLRSIHALRFDVGVRGI